MPAVLTTQRTIFWCLITLAVALWWLGFETVMRLRVWQAVNSALVVYRDAPQVDRQSPTGYAAGQRYQLYEGADTYHWVMQTQQMGAVGGLRVRDVSYDNAPHGRPVHWSSLPRWWLAAVAWADGTFTGRHWPTAVEHAALYGGVVLLGIFIVGIGGVVAWKWGAWPGVTSALGLTLVGPIYREFAAGSFDHHGIAGVAAFLTILFLLMAGAGWVREKHGGKVRCGWLPGPDTAYRWTIASAAAGAIGLWVSAASQVPVLVGLGLGAFMSARCRPSQSDHDKRERPEPAVWRVWGRWGAGLSVLFYLIEYAPGPFRLRLEVIHPLYAAAWLGLGELLHRYAQRNLPQRPAATKRDRIAVAAAALAVLAPAGVVLVAPATFLVSDPFLWRLHVDYIQEFGSIFTFLGADPTAWFKAVLGFNLPLLLGVPIALFWAWRRLPTPAKPMLAVLLPPIMLTLVLTVGQVRWTTIACSVSLAGLVAFVMLVSQRTIELGRDSRGTVGAVILCGAILTAYPLIAMPGLAAILQSRIELTAEATRKLLMRDFAYWFNRRTRAERAVVVTGPSATTELIYHGGVKGVGTMYWENTDGLRASIAVLGAADSSTAEKLIRERGITHVVLFSWSASAGESARLARGLRATAPLPEHAFALGLLNPETDWPVWLRPIAYRAPFPADKWVMVGEVDFSQTSAEAETHLARFLIATGSMQAGMRRLEKVRAEHPKYLPALISWAQLQKQHGPAAAFEQAVSAIQSLALKTSSIPLGDRIKLTRLHVERGQFDEAKLELQHAWHAASERALRRLDHADIAQFIELSRQLGIHPDTTVANMVQELAGSSRPRGDW